MADRIYPPVIVVLDYSVPSVTYLDYPYPSFEEASKDFDVEVWLSEEKGFHMSNCAYMTMKEPEINNQSSQEL